MQHTKIIFVLVTLVALSALVYSVNALDSKLEAQDQKLNELSATSTLLTNAVTNIGAQIQQPWMVVPTEQGNMAVSPFLIQALQSEQANPTP